MKQWIISALLRIYPKAWRDEYGPEFRDLLETLRFRVRTVVDVLWNGARQRLRATEPWVLIGFPLALLATLVYIVRIVAPPPFPTAVEGAPRVLGLLINLMVPVSCGLWTVARSGGTLTHAGLQAMKMGLLALAPHYLVSILLLTGVLGVVYIGPGDTPTTITEHGFAIGIYRVGSNGPPLDVVLVGQIFMTSFYLLGFWALGAIGGAFGYSVRRKHQASP